jgi:hypothetical protein
MPTDWELLARVAVGFALAFVIGFERELRGSPAGDRTFGLIGASIAGMTAVLWREAPQAVAGAITGIGFIGVGVVLHGENQFVRGVTTAAAIFARLRTMPGSASNRATSSSSNWATRSASNPANADRKPSRLRRMVIQESPD